MNTEYVLAYAGCPSEWIVKPEDLSEIKPALWISPWALRRVAAQDGVCASFGFKEDVSQQNNKYQTIPLFAVPQDLLLNCIASGDDMIVPANLLDEINATGAVWRDRAIKAEAELTALQAQIAEARAELGAVRALMDCYNVGGWTDAIAPMQRALKAEAELAALREVDSGL